MEIKTFEILPEKLKFARETFSEAHIEQYVELIAGDALKHFHDVDEIAFCFLDAEKKIYERCWDLVADKMEPHGMLIADNAISHFEELRSMIKKVESDIRYISILIAEFCITDLQGLSARVAAMNIFLPFHASVGISALLAMLKELLNLASGSALMY